MDSIGNFIVYAHISPSNKVYIGITQKNAKKRWGNGHGYSGNKHFYNAIQKYGWDNFKHVILFENLSEEYAVCIENYLILKYRSNEYTYGYNRSSGGSYSGGHPYGYHHSEKTRQLISDKKTGVEFSESHKKALSEAWVGRKQKGLCNPWNKGLNLKGAKHLENFVKAGKINAMKEARPIYQISLDGEIVNKFPSVTSGARAVGANTPEIFGVLAKKRPTARGYKWEYVDVYDNRMSESKINRIDG